MVYLIPVYVPDGHVFIGKYSAFIWFPRSVWEPDKRISKLDLNRKKLLEI